MFVPKVHIRVPGRLHPRPGRLKWGSSLYPNITPPITNQPTLQWASVPFFLQSPHLSKSELSKCQELGGWEGRSTG